MRRKGQSAAIYFHFTCINSLQEILHHHHHFPRGMEVHLSTQLDKRVKGIQTALRGQRAVHDALPRTPPARWLSCSARPGRTLRSWPPPATPRRFSSVAPPARGLHRCVRRSWRSKPGTWWVSSEPGSYLALGEGWGGRKICSLASGVKATIRGCRLPWCVKTHFKNGEVMCCRSATRRRC